MSNHNKAVAYKSIGAIEEVIRLNAYSTELSNFYNGKIGISCVLFEYSKIFNNNHSEDVAFDLLQESLLTQTKDASFKNGLGGMAYALAYLIENKFIECDFYEVFGSNMEQMIHSLKLQKMDFCEILYCVLIFTHIKIVCKNDKMIADIQMLESIIFEKLPDKIIEYISKCSVDESETIIKLYLKICMLSKSSCLYVSNFFEYIYNQYKSGVYASDFLIGSYLKNITIVGNHSQYQKLALNNINNDFPINIKRLYTIRQVSDYLFVDMSLKNIDIDALWNITNNEKAFQVLEGNPIGLGFGLSRILLLYLYKFSTLEDRRRLINLTI